MPNENGNSATANGKNKHEPITEKAVIEVTPIPEEIPLKPLKRVDSKREKQRRISFRGKPSFFIFHAYPIYIFYIDSASELAWDNPEEASELLTCMPEEDEESEEEELNLKPVSITNPMGNIGSMAPLSSISEVTLFNPDRKSMVSTDEE